MTATLIRTIDHIITLSLLIICPGHPGLTLPTTCNKSMEPLGGKFFRDSVFKENWVLPIPSIIRSYNQCIEMGVDTPKMSPI